MGNGQESQAKITPLLRDTEPFLGCEKYQPVLDSIYQGLGIMGGCSGVMPELHIQPGSGNLNDVIPGWDELTKNVKSRRDNARRTNSN